MPVVRVDAGRDAVRAYVSEQARQGLAHVITVVRADHDSVVAALDGLSEEQGNRVTLEGEWTVAQVMDHLNSSLDRSVLRIRTMAHGEEWTNPPVVAGQASPSPTSFEGLRQQYLDGMQALFAVLEEADEARGRELTADHALFGEFDWLEWAVYSHHVHTSDHIGQLQEARARLEQPA